MIRFHFQFISNCLQLLLEFEVVLLMQFFQVYFILFLLMFTRRNIRSWCDRSPFIFIINNAFFTINVLSWSFFNFHITNNKIAPHRWLHRFMINVPLLKSLAVFENVDRYRALISMFNHRLCIDAVLMWLQSILFYFSYIYIFWIN